MVLHSHSRHIIRPHCVAVMGKQSEPDLSLSGSLTKIAENIVLTYPNLSPDELDRNLAELVPWIAQCSSRLELADSSQSLDKALDASESLIDLVRVVLPSIFRAFAVAGTPLPWTRHMPAVCQTCLTLCAHLSLIHI